MFLRPPIILEPSTLFADSASFLALAKDLVKPLPNVIKLFKVSIGILRAMSQLPALLASCCICWIPNSLFL